jgi:integrase
MATKTAPVRSGSHLQRRGSVWWYRRDVPKDARQAFGCTAVWKSLDTSNETEAQRFEKEHDVEFERRLREARNARDPQVVANRIKADVRLTDGGTTVRGGFGTWGLVQQAGLNPDAALEAHQAVLNHVHDLLERSVKLRNLFRELGDLFAGPIGPDAINKFRAVTLAVAGPLTSPPEPSNAADASNGTTVLPAVPGFCTLGTILAKWQKEKRPAKKTLYSWKKILGKLVAHLQLSEKVGEDQLLAWNAASLTEENVIGWKDALVAAHLDGKTIENHLTILRTIYNYAEANKLVPATVVEAVRSVKYKAKRKAGTRKLGYTDDEARVILLATRAEKDPVLRWAPWVAACQGCRIDEICGAMVADIERDGDVWALHIRLDNRDDNAELKTENAERTLPVHPALIDEGFLDYVAGLPKSGALFGSIKPDMFGRRGGNGSKRVARWVRDKVGITDPRKAPSHSWRHRFRTIIRNPRYRISEDVADYVCGHGGEGGEGRNYGEYRDAAIAAFRLLPSPLSEHPATIAAA